MGILNKNTNPRGKASGVCVFIEKKNLFDLQVFSCLHATGAHFEARAVSEGCPLKIWVFAVLSDRIELGRTDAVGVTSRHDGAFITNGT